MERCIDLLTQFSRLLTRIQVVLIDDNMGDHSLEMDFKLSPIDPRIPEFANNEEFIDCMSELQRCSMSWTDILRPFLIDPRRKETQIISLVEMGFSQEFIDNVLLFPSGRPRGNMSTFVPRPFGTYTLRDDITVIPNRDDPTYIVSLSDGVYEEELAIPVIRYQNPASSGFYTSTSTGSSTTTTSTAAADMAVDTYCGTFYYFEPNSPYLLFTEKTLVSWNKVTACIDLGIPREMIVNYIKPTTSDEDVEPFTVEQIIDAFIYNNLASISLENPMIRTSGWYAAEDPLDQILCTVARQQEIDTVVLKYMNGLTRVVSEVLDTRARSESFGSIRIPVCP